MLFKRHCEHTGVTNFFSDTDPFIAAGSIVQITPCTLCGAPTLMMLAWVLRGSFPSLKPTYIERSVRFTTAASSRSRHKPTDAAHCSSQRTLSLRSAGPSRPQRGRNECIIFRCRLRDVAWASGTGRGTANDACSAWR